MRFEYQGRQFVIEFERKPRQVRAGWDEAKGEAIYKDSKYPYTTARIVEVTPGVLPGPYREATVGAYHKEHFSPEVGRIHALRLITKTVDREFRKAMWGAYMGRKSQAKK